jgi:hypothetical protein
MKKQAWLAGSGSSGWCPGSFSTPLDEAAVLAVGFTWLAAKATLSRQQIKLQNEARIRRSETARVAVRTIVFFFS